MRSRVQVFPTFLALVLAGLLSCVTINIYFPAEEVKKAEEDIVGDIREEQRPAPPAVPPEKDRSHRLQRFHVLLFPGTAYAQSETAVSNAAIRSLKEQIKARQRQLAPFYDRGVIGESAAGYLEILGLGQLSMQERAAVNRLVSAENEDRRRLYQEVAKALSVDPGQVDRIGSIFAQEWQKTAPKGWYVQDGKGRWHRK